MLHVSFIQHQKVFYHAQLEMELSIGVLEEDNGQFNQDLLPVAMFVWTAGFRFRWQEWLYFRPLSIIQVVWVDLL